MATGKEQKARDAKSTARACFDRDITHIRCGDWRQLGVTEITYLGSTYDLHGPAGVCTCCPRRAAVA